MIAKINFLKRIFSDVKESKANELSIRCPYCGKPGKSKLCIKLDTDVYHCWVCDIKGRGLYKIIKKIDASKLDEYNQKFNFSNKKVKEEVEIEQEIFLPDEFKILSNVTKKDKNYKDIVEYAFSRGFTKSTIWKFRVGLSNKFGWHRRLILPSFDRYGNLNYVVGRSIDPGEWFKYKNESRPKKKIIFNEIDIEWDKPLLLAEGPMDLVKVNMNKTCLLGSTLKEDYLLFERIILNNTPIVLLLDRDAIGKTIKIADLLTKYGIDVKINFPPGDLDLNDITTKEISELIRHSKRFDYNLKIKLKIGSI